MKVTTYKDHVLIETEAISFRELRKFVEQQKAYESNVTIDVTDYTSE
jgi:hypothetical protein